MVDDWIRTGGKAAGVRAVRRRAILVERRL
jgi:hypothetical protein